MISAIAPDNAGSPWERGLDGDAALRPRGGANPLVSRELGLGPLLRDRHEGRPELRQRGKGEIELLRQGGGEEIALGSGSQ